MADKSHHKPAITDDENPAEQAETTHPAPGKPALEPLDQPAAIAEPADATKVKAAKQGLKAFLKSKKGRIVLAVVGMLLLAIGALFVVPATRYAILGTVIKKDVTLTLTDQETKKPISDAEVTVTGLNAKSDNEGKVRLLAVPVGPQQVTIKKKYFKDLTRTVDVWLTKTAEPAMLTMEATGRQVPVKVLNKISRKPVEKAVVTALDTTAITDVKGEATLVLPADKGDQKGTVKLDGYNQAAITVVLTEQPDDRNVFTATPAGKLYFLSKRTGKINVMKSDLDSSNAKVVLEGTGKEEEHGTILLASRDWKYLLLKAKRDSENPKLYVINTSDDKLSVVDEGKATFELAGWANHRFIYRVIRQEGNGMEDGKESIKSFDADSGKLSKIDVSSGGHNEAFPNLTQIYSIPILVGDQVIVQRQWSGGYSYYYPQYADLGGKANTVFSMQADGSNKKVIIEKNAGVFGSTYELKLYNAGELYLRDGEKFYEYAGGKLTEKADLKANDFYKTYPTYLVSPSGNTTFWAESRDGKNTLLLGNKDGEDGKAIAELRDYKQYGWFTEDFLLVSKNGSELFILAKDTPTEVLKVTDYHKPAVDFYNYGGGYGGY